MAVKGYCIIEEVDNGLRIMPPAGWGARYSGSLRRVKQVNFSLFFSLVGKETPLTPYT